MLLYNKGNKTVKYNELEREVSSISVANDVLYKGSCLYNLCKDCTKDHVCTIYAKTVQTQTK